MYGVKYHQLIADGDSSCYKKILNVRPYGNLGIEKIECRNYLLLNFCNKLKAITVDTRFPLHIRKLIASRILRMRKAVKGAIHYRKNKFIDNKFRKIAFLKKDIDNIICHVLGKHIHTKIF